MSGSTRDVKPAIAVKPSKQKELVTVGSQQYSRRTKFSSGPVVVADIEDDSEIIF
jgi:hypothetical protein